MVRGVVVVVVVVVDRVSDMYVYVYVCGYGAVRRKAARGERMLLL